MTVNSLREERALETRAALLAAGRDLFTEPGYAATSIEAIAARARVTSGALYHHFRNKEDLFRAVVADVIDRAAVEAGLSSRAEPDEWSRVRAGCQAFLDSCLEPTVLRIVLVDGPAVLGREQWQGLDFGGLGQLRHALEVAMEQGAIERQPLDAMTALVFGALTEGVQFIAHAPDREQARKEVAAAVDRLLEGLTPRR
jgi:AcrR family transcriptional regulator